ncbi:MAG: hypothetical protein JJU46_06830 [Balneolaceae bacterium]|nr:hypothetical protein [Balneolaceae bacterium]MCH8548257.1 hypothetical protein [Balneolaceae bacterium]
MAIRFTITLFSFLLIASSLTTSRAESGDDDRQTRFIGLNYTAASLFDTPAHFLSAEAGRESSTGISWSFQAGAHIAGASSETALRSERLEFMFYLGPSLRITPLPRKRLSPFIGVMGGASFMRYEWRELTSSTTVASAVIVKPEIGIRYNTGLYTISAAGTLIYSRFIGDSVFRDRPDHFTAFPSLSFSIARQF